MTSYGASSMRRGLLALGAAAAIPAVIIATGPKLKDNDDADFIRHAKRARHEIWKEDAQGFIDSLAARISKFVRPGSKDDVSPSKSFYD